MIQLSGELLDLNKVMQKKPRNREEAVEMEAGHCSGLVKVTDGNKDLFVFSRLN